jgi:pimeloyl-ACP methyl ester carboxylesterase
LSLSPVAVVLVLHGGTRDSFDPIPRRNWAGARMWPIASTIRALGGRRGIVVEPVRYRVRGWNGAEASPVADARAALVSARERHGDVAVVLVGHSMGARTAIRVADDPQVSAVVGMAPWTPGDEPASQTAGRRLLLLQGDRDTVTPPADSLDFARRSAAAAADVARVVVRGDGHAMLRRWPTWHRLTVDFVLAAAGVRRLSPYLVDAYERGAAGDFEVPV